MRILYATDGSPGAVSALDLIVTSLAPDRVEHVEVVSVAPPLPAWRSVRPTGHPLGEQPWEAGHRLAAEAAVQQAIDRLRAGGFAASGTTRVGHAAEPIVMLASEAGAHLIVLGSREHSGPKHQLVGGVSAKVARYAVSPVLVVHGPPRIRQILVGYDGSSLAEEALRSLADLPLPADAGVTVCFAYDAAPPLSSGIAPTMWHEVEAAYREDLKQARAAAESAIAEAAAWLTKVGRPASGRTVQGAPGDQLRLIADEIGADLLIIGSRGLSAIERFLLGSVSASMLAHPPTSVLLVRRRA